MENIGVVCGRFQIFHNGHLAYVLAAKARCARLVVGITSLNPAKAAEQDNPCSYYERMQMIESVLLEAGVPREEFDIVPLPLCTPEQISFYLPQDACIFVAICDVHDHTRAARLREAGWRVEVLWEREAELSGATVREQIRRGGNWDALVPGATYRYLAAFNIDLRIRDAVNG